MRIRALAQRVPEILRRQRIEPPPRRQRGIIGAVERGQQVAQMLAQQRVDQPLLGLEIARVVIVRVAHLDREPVQRHRGAAVLGVEPRRRPQQGSALLGMPRSTFAMPDGLPRVPVHACIVTATCLATRTIRERCWGCLDSGFPPERDGPGARAARNVRLKCCRPSPPARS